MQKCTKAAGVTDAPLQCLGSSTGSGCLCRCSAEALDRLDSTRWTESLWNIEKSVLVETWTEWHQLNLTGFVCISTWCGSPGLWEVRWQTEGPTSVWPEVCRPLTPEPAEWPHLDATTSPSSASDTHHTAGEKHVICCLQALMGVCVCSYPVAVVADFDDGLVLPQIPDHGFPAGVSGRKYVWHLIVPRHHAHVLRRLTHAQTHGLRLHTKNPEKTLLQNCFLGNNPLFSQLNFTKRF